MLLLLLASDCASGFVAPQTAATRRVPVPSTTASTTTPARTTRETSTQLYLGLTRLSLWAARPLLTRAAALLVASIGAWIANKALLRGSLPMAPSETRSCPLFATSSRNAHGFSGWDLRLWWLQRLGRRPVLVVEDSAAINKLEFVQTLALPGRDKGLLATTDGNRHAYLRRLIHQAMSSQALHEAVPRLQQVAHQTIDTDVCQRPRFASIPLQETSLDYIMDTILYQYLGLSASTREQKDQLSITREILKTYTALDSTPTTPEQQTQARIYLAKRIQTQIKKLKRQPDASLLSQLIWAKETTDFGVQTLTDREVLDSVLCLIVAGAQSTTEVLTTALQILGTHPQHYQALVEEQRQLVDQQGPKLNYDLLDGAPQLQAIVQEALRLHPTNMSPRLVTEEVQLPNGQCVPAGWLVQFHSNQEDCTKSFLPDTTSASTTATPKEEPKEGSEDAATPPAIDNTNHNNNFFPFGQGPRTCLGQDLAILQLQVFLALLARSVDSFRVLGTTTHRLRMDRIEVAANSTRTTIYSLSESSTVRSDDDYTTTATAAWMREALESSPSSFA